MVVLLCVLLFFFKQKTAYEMRISDWSSDVCSSDLRHFMMVDGIDGRVHYIDIGRGHATPSVPENATVRIESIRAQASSADRMVDAVARANGGRYSVDLHLRHDLQASASYARSDERRVGKERVSRCRSRWSPCH